MDLDQLLAENSLGALLVSSLANIRYLTGFTGSNALLLVHRDRPLLATDPRYTMQAAHETTCRVLAGRGLLVRLIAPAIRKLRLRAIGIEAARMNVATFEALRKELPSEVELKPTTGLVEGMRAVKSPEEVEKIHQAVVLCSQAFGKFVRHVKPGVTELHLAAELDYQVRKLGAEGSSFETIVASGERSAYPHAAPTEKPIGHRELLLIDVGAELHGYSSDMTRMIHVGRPPAKARELHRVVLEAQLAALDAVRPGVSASHIDRTARQVLHAHGLAHLFSHSTGHGLGLEIHEPPRLGKGEKTRLKAGMVLTVEPGVYMEGFGGIRIEDTILVTSHGCQVLTPTSKELFVV
jgi:Xaa-Pro aminopeptidase